MELKRRKRPTCHCIEDITSDRSTHHHHSMCDLALCADDFSSASTMVPYLPLLPFAEKSRLAIYLHTSESSSARLSPCWTISWSNRESRPNDPRLPFVPQPGCGLPASSLPLIPGRLVSLSRWPSMKSAV